MALDDLNYAAAYEDEQGEEVYVDENGQIYSDDFLCTATKYKNKDTIFIKTKNWVSTKYKVNSKTELILPKYTAKHTLITQQTVTDAIGYYACSIQSLMQIAYMEGLISSYSDKNIKAFYNVCGTEISLSPKKRRVRLLSAQPFWKRLPKDL